MEGQVPERKGGRGKCATCGHPDHEKINEAIMGGMPMTHIARKWGINESSLRAHKKNHISAAYKAVNAATEAATGERKSLDQLRELIPILKNGLDWATGKQDPNGNFTVLPNVSQMVAIIREIRATLELLAKITGELDERPQTVINVLNTDQWLLARRAVVEALAPYPEARLAVASRLMLLEGRVVEEANTTPDVQEATAGDAH